MSLLIKNGRVVDPANKLDDICDVLVKDSEIAKVAKHISSKADETIDALGKIVMPGLVDMHVHLREPGREDKETVLTGTQAALKGGVTSLLAMPNTTPAVDCAENVRLVKEIVRRTAQVNVLISGAITKGRLGKEIVDIKQLKKEGVVAITDDGFSVDEGAVFSQALAEAKQHDMLVICHCEDQALSSKGVVNRGIIATRMGLRGISNACEFSRVERDIRLAQQAGSRIHIAHVSCRESVEIIARAKKQGIKVTAETCPHYFSLTEEAVLGYDTNFKMNPPLRSKEDREAVRQGLKAGVIDAISSDHAPHTESEKDIEFDRAEFGVIGLETELAVAISELIEKKVLDWRQLVERFCLYPARILGIDKPGTGRQGLAKGTLGQGRDADILILDPQKEWLVSRDNLVSKSKNCAFLGKTLKGVVTETVLGGRIAYQKKD